MHSCLSRPHNLTRSSLRRSRGSLREDAPTRALRRRLRERRKLLPDAPAYHVMATGAARCPEQSFEPALTLKLSQNDFWDGFSQDYLELSPFLLELLSMIDGDYTVGGYGDYTGIMSLFFGTNSFS